MDSVIRAGWAPQMLDRKTRLRSRGNLVVRTDGTPALPSLSPHVIALIFIWCEIITEKKNLKVRKHEKKMVAAVGSVVMGSSLLYR